MSESQDHRPPWRVSDLELTALAGVIEKFAGPAKEYSSQVAYLQSMSVLDLRDARARIAELESLIASARPVMRAAIELEQVQLRLDRAEETLGSICSSADSVRACVRNLTPDQRKEWSR